jgi:hypothetical protein
MVFERVRERSMAMVETAKTKAINGLAREDASRDRGEHMAWVRKWQRVRSVHRDKLVATGEVRGDGERSADLVSELGHSIEFGIALDLDTDKNKVTYGKGRTGAASIDMIAMGLATVGDDKGNNVAGKVNVKQCDHGEDRGCHHGQTAGRWGAGWQWL